VNALGKVIVGNVNIPQALQVFKCLSDETRLMLVLLVNQEQELCVCEMTHALQESQPKISRHLAQLRQCGLLSDQREGQWVYYRLAPQLPSWALDIIRAGSQGSAIRLAALTKRLITMGDRPTRRAALC
jgi:ArsR family transcriptional regulator, arsenate/arsenite/antimonite-responsive transcriptional repressor